MLIPKYQIEFKISNNKHVYIVNGEELPSVTYIVSLLDDNKSTNLMNWAKRTALNNMNKILLDNLKKGLTIDEDMITMAYNLAIDEPERQKNLAGGIGNQCHQAIDGLIKGERDYIKYLSDEKARNAFFNFWKWFKENGYNFISGDLVVASLNYKFGGRLDALAQSKDNIILLDWKTSNSIKATYAYQVGGYAIALEETYGLTPKKAFIVRFGKDNDEVEEKEVNLKLAIEIFKYLVNLYYINKKDLFL